MKKKRTFLKFILLFLLLLALGMVSYASYIYLTLKTPENEIKAALEAISSADKSQVKVYAPQTFAQAEAVYREAMLEWKSQNSRSFIWRDYSEVVRKAEETVELCNQAVGKASKEKHSLGGQIENQLNSVWVQLELFDKKYKNLPLPKFVFEQYGEARLKYDEAAKGMAMGHVYQAASVLKESERLISKALQKAQERSELFFAQHPQWMLDLDKAKELSKKGRIVLLINKMEATCEVLKSGKVLHTFDTEFGKNWMGDKLTRGDKATPEGVYHVTKKKSGAKTKYYKSLLLNYPNTEDKARFEQAQKKGKIPKNAHIGNLIEIHGEGGKGVNWTDGCIALSNEDMDVLYMLCEVNTPVIIIGSKQSLEDYLE